jgi:hypothetical protein
MADLGVGRLGRQEERPAVEHPLGVPPLAQRVVARAEDDARADDGPGEGVGGFVAQDQLGAALPLAVGTVAGERQVGLVLADRVARVGLVVDRAGAGEEVVPDAAARGADDRADVLGVVGDVVDDCVEALAAQPAREPRAVGAVARDVPHAGRQVRRGLPARQRGDLVPARCERRDDLAPEEPRPAQDQYAHGGPPG